MFLFSFTQAQLPVFLDNYATGVTFEAFGGSMNNVTIDNTVFKSGTASLKIQVGTAGYTGGALASATNKDLSSYNALTFWARSDNPAYALNVIGIGNNASTTVYQAERTAISLSTTWTKYFIPIPAPAKLSAEKGLFHFAEGGEATMYNIWMDDIQYENVTGGVIGTPTATFATETFNKAVGESFSPNGTSSIWPVNSVNQPMSTSKAYFTWMSSMPSVANVDALGNGSTLSAGSTNITAMLGSVNATGTLTVNVSAPLPIPTIAAPNPPARAAADLISIFSGVYTDLGATDWNPNWGQSTVVTEVMIAGNATKKYTNLNYQGVQFASAINASAMTKLHIDVWSPNAFTLKYFPIVPGQTEVAKLLTIPAAISGTSAWNSFDIDLATIGTSPLSNIIQFKFEGTPAGSTVYLDNIYFHKGTTLPVKLSEFKVTRRSNTAVLNWKTEAEINSKGFAVERSNDGRDWTELQFINSSSNSNTTRSYSMVDEKPVSGLNLYRLRQVDLDGKETLSSTVSLKMTDKGVEGFSFYPNPAKDNIVVLLEKLTGNNASLHLINAAGKMVKNVILSSQNSGSNISIDISGLPTGVYYLSLKDGPAIQTTKVIIN